MKRILAVLMLCASGVLADELIDNGDEFAVEVIDGTPYIMVDLLGEVGDAVAGASWMDTRDAGWVKKTVALPVNLVAKLTGGAWQTVKSSGSYAKSNPWKSLLITAVASDYLEDSEMDAFGLLSDDEEEETHTPTSNGEIRVNQGDESKATIAGDVIRHGTITQGDGSTLIITDHSGVED